MPLSLVNKAQAALLSIALLVLPGCTGMRLIDNQVNSFAPQTVAKDSSYRFERLPSQSAQGDSQTQLEALARQALAKVGLHEANAADAANLTVQVSVQQRQVLTLDPPHIGFGLGRGFGHGGIHGGHRGALFPGLGDAPLYWREVSLLMRDTQGKVVFESRASHEGIWSDSGNVIAAMLQAALQGFPTPANGPRRIDIEIPR
jgi:hypothetical protein